MQPRDTRHAQKNKNFPPEQICYLASCLTFFCVVFEIFTVITILQCVRLNPLLVSKSSLCRHSCHFSQLVTKLNLKPLVLIVCSSKPAPLLIASYFHIQSATIWTTIGIILRGGSQLDVFDHPALHAKRLKTSCKFNTISRLIGGFILT